MHRLKAFALMLLVMGCLNASPKSSDASLEVGIPGRNYDLPPKKPEGPQSGESEAPAQSPQQETPPTAAQDSECTDIQSHACRAKAASILQTGLSEQFPQMRVRADGDVIVFADPSLFGTQEDRRSYLRQSGPTIEKQLCQFGFKKMRIESATKTTPADEYAFSCATSEHPTQAGAEAPTSTRSASQEPVSEPAHAPGVMSTAHPEPSTSSTAEQKTITLREFRTKYLGQVLAIHNVHTYSGSWRTKIDLPPHEVAG